MDKNVYGNSLAAIRLSEMVGEHPNSKAITRKVGRLLESFNRRINAIELIQDRGDIEHLYILLIEDVEKNGLNFLGFDPKNYVENESSRKITKLECNIRTHLLNVIKGRYKAWKHGERDSIIRTERIGNATVHRRVGGISSVYINEIGTERFERRAK